MAVSWIECVYVESNKRFIRPYAVPRHKESDSAAFTPN